MAGDARATVASLPGPFDLVFIDAEKDDYVDHLQAVADRVRPGGLILADNVISHDLSAYQAMLRVAKRRRDGDDPHRPRHRIHPENGVVRLFGVRSCCYN